MSGMFQRKIHGIPRTEVPLREARRVSVDDMITAIHKNLSDSSIIQFSCAATFVCNCFPC
jgi:hypothetical protein